MHELPGLELVTPPTAEPVSLAEAKGHLRVEHDADNDLITALIKAAREQAEVWTRRQLVTATWKLTLDDFPGCGRIELPLPPLQSVSSVQYIDPDGATQTVDPSVYLVRTNREPGSVLEAYGQTWPVSRGCPDAVAVTFVAGYGAADAVPAGIKAGMKLLIGHWYENREAVIMPRSGQVLPLPLAVETLFIAARWGGYA